MAEDINPQVTAVVFVADSSLTIRNEWNYVLLYTKNLFQCFNETPEGNSILFAFVTYGPADTHPTPILCKRFFVKAPIVIKEMRDAPSRLGIGQTNSGGSNGMAALEGFVAAIELFDALQSALQDKSPIQSNPKPRTANHIIHLASAAPDASTRPRWNESPSLDFVTWKDIPSLFKKRHIQFSSINLRPNLPRFSEIHSATLTSSSSKEPWFSVQPPHSILLANFPPPRASVKRPGDVPCSNHLPDNKRPRILNSAMSSSPKLPGSTVPTVPPKIAHPKTVVRPSEQHLSTSRAPSEIRIKLKRLEEQKSSLHVALGNALKNGNFTLSEKIRANILRMEDMSRICLRALQMLNMQSSSGGSSGKETALSTSSNRLQSSGSPKENKAEFSSGSVNSPLAVVARFEHPPIAAPTASTSSEPPTRLLVTNPPAMVNQVRMPLNQQQEVTRSLTGVAVSSRLNVDIPAGAQQSSTDGGRPMPVVWQGSLSWNGMSSGARKEITVFVNASTAVPTMSHAETWPKELQLVPTRDSAVPITELHAWIKRTKPVICAILPQQDVADPKGNELALKMLFNLLSSRNIYAAAAWTLPSGERKNNVLFIPMSQSGIAAAFFPLTGIPETPKTVVVPGPGGSVNPLNSINDILARLPPEQQEMFMAAMTRHQQQQGQQQQYQKQQAMMNVAGTGSAITTTQPMGVLNVPQQSLPLSQHADLAFSGNVQNYGVMHHGMVQAIGMEAVMDKQNLGMKPHHQHQQAQSATMMRMAASSVGKNSNPEMVQLLLQQQQQLTFDKNPVELPPGSE